ncbi:hypothetical protein SLS56_008292 [Neofusicoccum ribis]|uniref:Uncharacterized protein n=1 Tax=Neofusicoccum ribis TaxID=45134 RepID=A0ABR3SLC1_9PEZI
MDNDLAPGGGASVELAQRSPELYRMYTGRSVSPSSRSSQSASKQTGNTLRAAIEDYSKRDFVSVTMDAHSIDEHEQAYLQIQDQFIEIAEVQNVSIPYAEDVMRRILARFPSIDFDSWLLALREALVHARAQGLTSMMVSDDTHTSGDVRATAPSTMDIDRVISLVCTPQHLQYRKNINKWLHLTWGEKTWREVQNCAHSPGRAEPRNTKSGQKKTTKQKKTAADPAGVSKVIKLRNIAQPSSRLTRSTTTAIKDVQSSERCNSKKPVPRSSAATASSRPSHTILLKLTGLKSGQPRVQGSIRPATIAQHRKRKASEITAANTSDAPAAKKIIQLAPTSNTMHPTIRPLASATQHISVGNNLTASGTRKRVRIQENVVNRPQRSIRNAYHPANTAVANASSGSNKPNKRKASEPEPTESGLTGKKPAKRHRPTSSKPKAKGTTSARPQPSRSTIDASSVSPTAQTTAVTSATSATGAGIPAHSIIRGKDGFELIGPRPSFVVGHDQTDKLTMHYFCNDKDGTRVKKFHTWSKTGERKVSDLDWGSAAEMTNLNKWANQWLRRWGCPPLREDMTLRKWTEEECQWLRDQAGRYKDADPRPSAKQMCEEFNQFWAGRCEAYVDENGEAKQTDPRPNRTVHGITSHVNRHNLWATLYESDGAGVGGNMKTNEQSVISVAVGDA